MEEQVLAAMLREALDKYGFKLRIVLETAIEIAKRNRLSGNGKLGDFDYRALVEALRAKGFDYNPSQLLRILEREYGIIVTSYHTSNQHWFKFKDLELVEKVLKGRNWVDSSVLEYDPEVTMIKIQVRSIRPKETIEFLKKLTMKPRLSIRDIEKFEEFAFSKLPKVVKLLRLAEEYEDELAAEIHVLREILDLAYEVSERIGKVDLDLGLGLAKEVAMFNEKELIH